MSLYGLTDRERAWCIYCEHQGNPTKATKPCVHCGKGLCKKHHAAMRECWRNPTGPVARARRERVAHD